MDCKITENYFKEKARMAKANEIHSCSISCVDCPLSQFNNQERVSCYKLESRNSDKAIAIVQKWSDDHPQKTYKEYFFEKFPNANRTEEGTPLSCRASVYGEPRKHDCYEGNCDKCWNEVLPE